MKPSRLVSVVIPAYKALYFEASLASALRQTHDEIEIVICDDCPTEEIADIVERMRAESPWPIYYFRNEIQLGEIQNAVRCISKAKGHYIKFLYDDDIILPDCVRVLVNILEQNPSITLATSRRRSIDEHDNFLPENMATRFPFPDSTIIEGKGLVSFLSQHIFNFIGEPTCVMCRTADVKAFGKDLMSIRGEPMVWLGDLAMYVKLLRVGNLAMVDQPLSYFRISTQQYSQIARTDRTANWDCHQLFKRMILESGWTKRTGSHSLIEVAPLSDPTHFKIFNLLAHFDHTAESMSSLNVKEWLSTRTPNSHQRALIDQRLKSDEAPSILVVLSDMNNDTQKLQDSLRSMTSPQISALKFKVIVLSAKNDLPGHTLGNPLNWAKADIDNRSLVINDLIAQHSDCEWVMLIDAGTTFTASGLQSVALQLVNIPDCDAVFADELHRQYGDEPGIVLRPDFNLDYFLSFPLMTAKHWFFRRETFLHVGGFDPSFSEAMEFDLILRLIEAYGVNRFHHVSEPLLVCDVLAAQDLPDEIASLQRHLHVRQYENSQIIQTRPRRYHIQYHHTAKPLVSILVTTKGRLDSVSRCVESLLEKTTYPHYEILIIDNNSQDTAIVSWLNGIIGMGSTQIKVVRSPHTSSHSYVNNLAAQQALGEYFVLLSDATVILQPNWLEELLNHAQRPEVGVVGAKLVYPNGEIQHAGIVLGLNGPAKNVFMNSPQAGPSYMQRLEVDQNYSAVSAACLMVRASLFNAVRGLDEVDNNHCYNDIDLCLKISATGHLVVWTPHVTLLYESTVAETRLDFVDDHAGLVKAEEAALYSKWLPVISNDPAYNRNLSLSGEDFSLEFNAELTWQPLPWQPLPKVLGYPVAPWGSAAYRLIKPFEALRGAVLMDGAMTERLLSVSELARFNPDSVIIQRRLNADGLDAIRSMKAYSKATIIYDLDDYPMLNDNDLRTAHVNSPLGDALSKVDRLIVSSTHMAEALTALHSDIRVLEDRLPLDWWQGLISLRRQGKKLRLGLTAIANRPDDLVVLRDVVQILANEVEWVFLGPCPPEISPYIHDLRPEPAVDFYPATLASLNLDLALVPAKQTLSNELRSNLLVLRYGAIGVPVICSDIRCFQDELTVTRVKNTTEDWVEAIRAHINDVDACERMGDELHRQVTANWMLDDKHLGRWLAAWLPG